MYHVHLGLLEIFAKIVIFDWRKGRYSYC